MKKKIKECPCYENASCHMYEIVGMKYQEVNNCNCKCHALADKSREGKDINHDAQS